MKKVILIISLLVLTGSVFSQTLELKWRGMLENSENYQAYKVIKKTELSDFWKSTNDTIQQYQKLVKTERTLNASQKGEIVQLKAQMAELNTVLSQHETDKNNVTFLGIKANKFAYLSTLSLLLVIALIGIGVFFYLYKNSNTTAIQKINAQQLISKEFDEYKHSKIEMERKLRRELQTQVNKLEEYKKSNG